MGSASRSSFYGFEIAKTGLFISQHNLNVTGHNISNANTIGYTRQRLVTSAIEPYSGIGKIATFEKGQLGGGTTSHYIDQIRNAFYDSEYRSKNSMKNSWDARLTGLEYIEDIFDEPNEVGILSHITDFKKALSDLGGSSTSQSERAAFQSAAIKLTSTFNAFYDQLVTQQQNLNEEVKTMVDKQVNSIAERIGVLNNQIYAFEISGEHANDLRDQRNVLLDELSGLVEINVREYTEVDNEPTRLQVTMGSGGSKGDLINHTTVNKLVMHEVYNSIYENPAAQNVIGDPTETVVIIAWAHGYTPTTMGTVPGTIPTNNIEEPALDASGNVITDSAGNIIYGVVGNPANPYPYPGGLVTGASGPVVPTAEQMKHMYELLGDGAIKGKLTLRDGNDSENIGIPYLVHQLDTLARSIVKEFNTIHNAGYSHPTSGSSVQGYDFFADYDDQNPAGNPSAYPAPNPYDYSNVTAGNFRLADGMTELADLWKIACSDEVVTAEDYVEGNNKNTIEKLLGLFESTTLPVTGSFTGYYNSFLASIATTTSYSETQYTTANTLTTSADNRRMSVSQVSVDEEMTNMIKFNQSFNACSRMITTLDEMLDKVVNGMGVVGR